MLTLKLQDETPPIMRDVTHGVHDEQRRFSVEDVGPIDAQLVCKHPWSGDGWLTVGLLVARPRGIQAVCELGQDAPEAVVHG